MDYATPENVEVEVGEVAEGRMSPPSRSSHLLSFRLLMSKNSEGRAEQITLVAESRYIYLNIHQCTEDIGTRKADYGPTLLFFCVWLPLLTEGCMTCQNNPECVLC